MSSTNTKKSYGYIEDADKKIEEYTSGRKETTQKNIDEMNTVYDEQIKQAKDSTLLQEQELTDSYNDIVDANEIQKEINLRQIRENVANMGLSNSGLSSTEQTAAILSASNSNAKAKLQLQKSVDSLKNQLANHITGVEDNRRAYQLSQEQSEEADIAKFTSDISGKAYDAEATAMENDENNRKSGLKWALDNYYLTEPEYYQYLADGTSLNDIQLNLDYKTKKKDEDLRVETLEKMRDKGLITPSQCYSYIQNGTPISQVKINPQQSGTTQAEKNRRAGLEALYESGDITPLEYAQYLTDGTTVKEVLSKKEEDGTKEPEAMIDMDFMENYMRKDINDYINRHLKNKTPNEKIGIILNDSSKDNDFKADVLDALGFTQEDVNNYRKDPFRTGH